MLKSPWRPVTLCRQAVAQGTDAQVESLVGAADAVGEMLKYSHQGFLANVRMLRMGGLAAIELAQTIRVAVRHRCWFCLSPEPSNLRPAPDVLLAGGTPAGRHAIAREG